MRCAHPPWPALLLAVMLVSGHAAGQQLMAWTGMAVECARSMPVLDAIRSEVDGSRPCAIGTTVAALAIGKPQAPSISHPRPDLAPAVEPLLILPARAPVGLLPDAPASLSGRWPPDVPTPPPQGC